MTGFTIKKNAHFGYKIEVKADVQKVWNQLVNAGEWHLWDTELKEAQVFGEFKLGAEGDLVPRTGPKLSYRVSSYVPKKSYAIEVKMPIGYMIITRTMTSQGDTTTFEDDIELTGFMRHVFGLVLGSGFKKVLPEVMHNFKQLVEKM